MNKDCINCEVLNVTSNKKVSTNKFINDIIKNIDVEKLKKTSPTKKDINMTISHKINNKNTWLFFWAADSNDDILLDDLDDAYNNNKNNGITKTNNSGEFTININCPSVYLLNNSTHTRHIHFVILKGSKWDMKKIYTINILCKINFNKMTEYVNDGKHLIVNAIDIKGTKYKQNIPNSYYLKLPKSGTSKKKTDTIKKFINKYIKNYSKLNKLFINKTIKIHDIPMVIYCAHNKCDASNKLSKELIKLGFNNLVDYSDGIEGWFNQISDTIKKSQDNISPDKGTDKVIDFEGVNYTVTPDNKVLDDDLKIVGRYNNDKVIFSKPIYIKTHNKLKKEINVFYDDDPDDDDSDNDDDDSDDDDDDDSDDDSDDDDDDDSDNDDDEDDDDKQKDDDDDDDDDDIQKDDDDDDDDDEDDDDEDDYNSLSKTEINEIHSMSIKQLRKELKKVKSQIKTGGSKSSHELMAISSCF